MSSYQSPILPSSIQVRFPANRCNGNSWSTPFTTRYYVKVVTLASLGLTNPNAFLPPPAGTPGRTQIFTSQLQAYYEVGASAPNNQSDLDSNAIQVATDFYNLLLTQSNQVFNGVIAPPPNALQDANLWEYSSSDCVTKVIQTHWNAYPQELLHLDPSGGSGCATVSGDNPDIVPGIQFYGPAPASGVSFNTSLNRYNLYLQDGRLACTPIQGTLDTVPCTCGCNPSNTMICLTVTDQCDSTAIAGATVTVRNSGGTTVGTFTTDGSGHGCFGANQTGTYNFYITKTGFFDGFIAVAVSTCGTTVNRSTSMYPTEIPTTFLALVCCGCAVTSSTPVTVNVTQTAGGSFTGSCVITSSSGCTINLPATVPLGGVDFVFSATFSSPGFISQTTSFTFFGGSLGFWNCSSGVGFITLVNSNTNWCSPVSDCFTAIPSSVTVTFTSGDPCIPNGPYVCNLFSVDVCGGVSYKFSQVLNCPIGTELVTITVGINQSGGSSCVDPPSGTITWSAGGGSDNLPMISGSALCPIGFVAQSVSTGSIATVSQ